jgi:hypothetical protein
MPKIKSMQVNINHQEQTFYQYVLKHMSVANFNTLPKQLGVSSRMASLRLKNPQKMPLEMIKKLAEILKVSVQYLVEEFQAGDDTLTAGEYKQLIQTD